MAVPKKATPLALVYDGTALDVLVYRATAGCPPTLADFRSHESLGLPYPPALFIRATGISVYRTRKELERSRSRFDLGPATVTLELRSADVTWAESGRHGHLTIWAPPGLLLERVVQCDYDQ
jgi:hypothetical protein